MGDQRTKLLRWNSRKNTGICITLMDCLLYHFNGTNMLSHIAEWIEYCDWYFRTVYFLRLFNETKNYLLRPSKIFRYKNVPIFRARRFAFSALSPLKSSSIDANQRFNHKKKWSSVIALLLSLSTLTCTSRGSPWYLCSNLRIINKLVSQKLVKRYIWASNLLL